MPVYEYRCRECGKLTTRVSPITAQEKSVPCEHCGETAERIISRPSVHLSRASKLDRLDPKYDRMVDRAMASTGSAEPDNVLKRMKPFSED